MLRKKFQDIIYRQKIYDNNILLKDKEKICLKKISVNEDTIK